MSTQNIIVRFWERVDIGRFDTCWEWSGYRDKGYGQIRTQSGLVLTHRLAYEFMWGPIPGKLFVCHRCDNPPCCNPWHLFIGTQLDNMRDMVSKGRQNRWKGRQRGEGHKNAKLTTNDIERIRTRYKVGDITKADLGRQYKVSYVTIAQIVKGRTWKHV